MVSKGILINKIKEETGISKKDVAKVIESYISLVSASLATGDEVQMPGFGTFRVKDIAERTGRNPQTGEDLVIPAHKRVAFKAGKALSDAVNA